MGGSGGAISARVRRHLIRPAILPSGRGKRREARSCATLRVARPACAAARHVWAPLPAAAMAGGKERANKCRVAWRGVLLCVWGRVAKARTGEGRHVAAYALRPERHAYAAAMPAGARATVVALRARAATGRARGERAWWRRRAAGALVKASDTGPAAAAAAATAAAVAAAATHPIAAVLAHGGDAAGASTAAAGYGRRALRALERVACMLRTVRLPAHGNGDAEASQKQLSQMAPSTYVFTRRTGLRANPASAGPTRRRPRQPLLKASRCSGATAGARARSAKQGRLREHAGGSEAWWSHFAAKGGRRLAMRGRTFCFPRSLREWLCVRKAARCVGRPRSCAAPGMIWPSRVTCRDARPVGDCAVLRREGGAPCRPTSRLRAPHHRPYLPCCPPGRPPHALRSPFAERAAAARITTRAGARADGGSNMQHGTMVRRV
eukprot:354471-Chlamydomonas_euryale.AAC.6